MERHALAAMTRTTSANAHMAGKEKLVISLQTSASMAIVLMERHAPVVKIGTRAHARLDLKDVFVTEFHSPICATMAIVRMERHAPVMHSGTRAHARLDMEEKIVTQTQMSVQLPLVSMKLCALMGWIHTRAHAH